MRLLLIFALAFIGGYLFTESWATEPPPSNEMEMLLKKIKANTQAVGKATRAAHAVSEAMVEEKVAEKAELKERVVVAEAKVEQMAIVQEVFVAKMVAAGVDTATVELPAMMKGPAYDQFLEYQKNGGAEDFEYFRLYIYK